ncbi:MAG: glycosyltransferase [Phyllobacterium sp.]|uniref:glycosyltransferase n=1 Tax=Phyllobacterium sp. TaxID=1871046 RepID=UPI0030F1107F
MCESEAALAARLCQTGMSKDAIVSAFRASICNGTSLIDELAASGATDEAIARAIAAELGLAFASLPEGATIVASSAAYLAGPSHTRQLTVVTTERELLYFLAPTMANVSELKKIMSRNPDAKSGLRITTLPQLLDYIRSYHGSELMENCVHRIDGMEPERSSRVVLSGNQGMVVGAAASFILLGLTFHLHELWRAYHFASLMFFFACIVLRFMAMLRAKYPSPKSIHVPQRRSTYPFYSVMIALYKEAAVVPQLTLAMQKLNWPRSRLEVLFLCEADDAETLKAFEKQSLPHGFKVVPVPNIGPRTKPKALNYGLQLSRGEFIVVYDAEDRPHPDQLIEAWQRFEVSESKLACLQAPLVVSNASACLLSRLFAFEYAVHFAGMLPWLAGHRFILPLGGSSNHFRRACLDAAGGWDPFNVTEDAELGARLARCGYDVGVISRPTLEDAPTCVDPWLRQRTRWIKGWVHTWLVEMRNPAAFLRDVGVRRFIYSRPL